MLTSFGPNVIIVWQAATTSEPLFYLLHWSAIPDALSYIFAAAATIGVLFILVTVTFMGNVLTIISLLSVTRECGLRRHVAAR